MSERQEELVNFLPNSKKRLDETDFSDPVQNSSNENATRCPLSLGPGLSIGGSQKESTINPLSDGVVNVDDEHIVETLVLPSLSFPQNPVECVQEVLYLSTLSVDNLCSQDKCKNKLEEELSLEKCRTAESTKWMFALGEYLVDPKAKQQCLTPFWPSENWMKEMGLSRSGSESITKKLSSFRDDLLEIIGHCLRIFDRKIPLAPFHKSLIQYFVYELDLNYTCLHTNLDGAFCLTIYDVSKEEKVEAGPIPPDEFHKLMSRMINMESMEKKTQGQQITVAKNESIVNTFPEPMEKSTLDLCKLWKVQIDYNGYMVLKVVRHHANHYTCSKFYPIRRTTMKEDPYIKYNDFNSLRFDPLNAAYFPVSDEYTKSTPARRAFFLLKEMNEHLQKTCAATACTHCETTDKDQFHEMNDKVSRIVSMFTERH